METKNSSRNIFDLPEGSNADNSANQPKEAPPKKTEDTYQDYYTYRESTERANNHAQNLSSEAVDKAYSLAQSASSKLSSAKSHKNVYEALYAKYKKGTISKNVYSSTVGGKNIIEILNNAKEKKWMTGNQLTLLNKSPEQVVSENKFTTKENLTKFVESILNNNWMQKLANPTLTKDIVKKKCMSLCLIVTAITLISCVVTILTQNYEQPLMYLGGLGVGLGSFYLNRAIVRLGLKIFLKQNFEKGVLSSKIWGVIIELIVSFFMGQFFLAMFSEIKFPATTIPLSAFYCGLGALYLRGVILANSTVQNFVLKIYPAIKNGLYPPLFAEADGIQNMNLGIYCVLNQGDMEYIIETLNLDANTQKAKAELDSAENAVTKAEAEYRKYQSAYHIQKEKYDTATTELVKMLKAAEGWNSSPTVNDILKYNKTRTSAINEDKYFPKYFWYEKRNASGSLTGLARISHNYNPIAIKVNCKKRTSTTLVDNIDATCKIIKGIQKICPNKITRIYVVDPRASSAVADFSKYNIHLTDFDLGSNAKPDDFIYSVSNQNEYRALCEAVSQKRKTINDYINTPDYRKNTSTIISSFNDIRSQKNADLLPYDILLIYLPREDNSGSVFSSPEQLDELVGMSLSEYGILPIYVHETLSHRWEGIVNDCINQYIIAD